jgi:hypothetical protein
MCSATPHCRPYSPQAASVRNGSPDLLCEIARVQLSTPADAGASGGVGGDGDGRVRSARVSSGTTRVSLGGGSALGRRSTVTAVDTLIRKPPVTHVGTTYFSSKGQYALQQYAYDISPTSDIPLDMALAYGVGPGGKSPMSVFGGRLDLVHGTVRVFRQECATEDAIEFHAFAPLDTLACV